MSLNLEPPTTSPTDSSFAFPEQDIPTDIPKRPGRSGIRRNRQGYSFSDIVKELVPRIKAQKNEYIHTRFKKKHEIMLLLLHKAENTKSPIDCSFIVTSLDDIKYPYEALSYFWGTKDSGHWVNVHSSNVLKPMAKGGIRAVAMRARPHKLQVRDNLYSALLQFRKPGSGIILWIDAICIDQSHGEEKNLQVSMMAEIYSKAENVCIWLGEGDPRDKDALDFARTILDLNSLEQIVQNEDLAPRWDALSNLMRREWFSRRWVIQELAMAKSATVHCGDGAINWGDFADAVALFVTNIDSIRRLFKTARRYNNPNHLGDVAAFGANILVNAHSNLFRRSPNREPLERLASLETLMATLSTFEASDPRDTVYALLAISKVPSTTGKLGTASRDLRPNYTTSQIEADYTKENDEVYVDFTAFCIESSGSLDIICRPWAPTGVQERSTLDKEDPRT